MRTVDSTVVLEGLTQSPWPHLILGHFSFDWEARGHRVLTLWLNIANSWFLCGLWRNRYKEQSLPVGSAFSVTWNRAWPSLWSLWVWFSSYSVFAYFPYFLLLICTSDAWRWLKSMLRGRGRTCPVTEKSSWRSPPSGTASPTYWWSLFGAWRKGPRNHHFQHNLTLSPYPEQKSKFCLLLALYC